MTALKESIKNSWELKSLSFIFRAMAAMLCVGYVMIMLNGAIGWFVMKKIRLSPLDALPTYAEKQIEKHTPEKITMWIRLRPVSERLDIIKRLDPYYPRLVSPTFLLFSAWQNDAGHVDDGLFWYQLARYRLRFDALRCGFASATDDITGFTDMAVPQYVIDVARKDPTFTKKSLQRVLDFDAKYPAHNDPHAICGEMARINSIKLNVLPEDRWADIRHTLRKVTEYAIARMDDGKDKKSKLKKNH